MNIQWVFTTLDWNEALTYPWLAQRMDNDGMWNPLSMNETDSVSLLFLTNEMYVPMPQAIHTFKIANH